MCLFICQNISIYNINKQINYCGNTGKVSYTIQKFKSKIIRKAGASLPMFARYGEGRPNVL